MEKYQWDQQDITKVAGRDKDEQMQDTKRDDFKAPKHKSAKLAVYTNTNWYTPTGSSDTSSVCTLWQAGLWGPAVGCLVPCLLYLCLKGGGPHEAQTPECRLC